MDEKNVNDFYEEGQINFRKCKTKRMVRHLIKGAFLVLVAFVAGAISSIYIVEMKYSDLDNIMKKVPLISGTLNNKTYVNTIAEEISPAIVGVSNNQENFFNSDAKTASGIIFDSSGYILTDANITKDNKKIYVKLSTGKIFTPKDIRVIGSDSKLDISVIKVNAENLPKVKFATDDSFKLGDVVVALNNSKGEENMGTLNVGVVSSIKRKYLKDGSNMSTIETSALLNNNELCSALVNDKGQVIGIGTLIFDDNKNGKIGTGITSGELKNVIDNLVKYGKVDRVQLGIKGGMAIVSNNTQGYYVSEVDENGAGYKAGLKPTDIIMEVNGVAITKYEKLSNIIDKSKNGDIIKCKVWRNNSIISIDVKF